ncbi:MAG: Trehalose utilization [Candidatus Hydrogenedentes bacterium ADurb.Bin179]|nr:MAG: Trehalose utilization [Candidatus Hydrogenedentes bacterium ADurb.Bin179]
MKYNMLRAILILITVFLILFMTTHVVRADALPLKALLITGQNNHNWQLSHPILKTIIEDTGMFQVDIAITAPEGGDMSTFTPVFTDYSVIILDYTGDPWPDTTRQAFLDYVRGGGGVVVYHAADNAFPDWPEFNKIIGLGGWGDRNEKHGPYVFWRNGELVRDMRPGPGGAHGKQHQYVVTHRVTDHPIANGLPEAWLHEKDELYHHLRGPAENMTLLATAWSAPETGGSGEHEPVLFTIAYGEGRVFHTVLGHAGDDPPPAMRCVGFIVTLQRGAEWAATGKVTQPVPNDFPTAERVRLRPDFKQKEPKTPQEEQACSRASVKGPAPD